MNSRAMKLPLHVELERVDGRIECHGIGDSEDRIVVETDCGAYPPTPEDAAFIVKAANAHNDLVELRDAITEWKRVVFKGAGPETEACWSRVTDALTKAGVA